VRVSGWAAALALVCGVAYGAEVVPDGYELSVFADGFEQPVALAVAPDGRVFVGQKDGMVWIVESDGTAPALFATIDVFDFSEAGLLGIAVDPGFASNGYVYFFATVQPDEQQILRYTAIDGVGTNAKIIRAGLPTSGQMHNGGGLRIGPDGKLYFSVGDTGTSELSQQMQTFAGKVCRINLDGSTPTDNPFITPTGTPRAILALGFRNPFRFCFAPDGRLFVMDVGSDGDARREEINLVTPGSNGGWPLVEGTGTAEVEGPLLQPLFAYNVEGSAITGCTFNSNVRFPRITEDGLFHLDFVSNKLFFLSLADPAAPQHTEFMQADGGVTDLVGAPLGGLLYTEMFSGAVKWLRSSEVPPTLTPPPDPQAAPPPVTVGTTCGTGVMLLLLPTLSVMGAMNTRKRRVTR